MQYSVPQLATMPAFDILDAMGNRLTKIYTRTGDGGETGLADGSRVAKDHPRIDAMGAVDELNSAIGLIMAEPLEPPHRNLLEEVQQRLFDLGGELSMPGASIVVEEQVAAIEQALDKLNATLPPLQNFVLPGGGRAAAAAHLARAICRRAERDLFRLAREAEVNEYGTKFLNRLSDLLFVFARVLAKQQGGEEQLWNYRRADADH